MGEYGLPALMKDAKRFKVRGKGHEVSDRQVSPKGDIFSIFFHSPWKAGMKYPKRGKKERSE
jgi:hypothetical protein